MRLVHGQVLLEHEAEIEYKNSFGQAALSRAARYGSAAVAKVRLMLLVLAHIGVDALASHTEWSRH